MELKKNALHTDGWKSNLAEAAENLGLPARVQGDANVYANVHFFEASVDEATLTAKRDELQAEHDAFQYGRDRRKAYPKMEDQLDMQYHDEVNDTTTWKDAVQAIKDANPKS
jgi:hypothetical protein